MKITFPNKTAEQILKECNNDTGIGKLLWNTDWYAKEDFFIKEKCRPRTIEVSDEIEHKGKTWNECKELVGEENMLNFPEMVWFILEYCKVNDKYPDYDWSWTSSRSSDGYLVDVGSCVPDGVCVGRGESGFSSSDWGVRFFR